MTRIAYKYRANVIEESNGKKRDIEALFSNTLYAASFDSLNDPFEGSSELPPEGINGNEWIFTIKRNIASAGIYSLTRLKPLKTFPDDELMWSHYANSHKGFCIKYDLDILSKNSSPEFDLSSIIDVKYQSDCPKVRKTDGIELINKKVFGTKSVAWKKENEVRLVFKRFGNKPIVKGAVKAIYFGLYFDYDERYAIMDKFSHEDIEFYQIEHEDNTYNLKASKLMFEIEYETLSLTHNPMVDNYMILYKSPNKDRNTVRKFVEEFRLKLTKPSNLTIIDDTRVVGIIDKERCNMTFREKKILSEHLLAYSSFDAPTSIWMYPEK